MDFINIKNFSSSKDIVKKNKKQAVDCEETFAKTCIEKGHLSRFYWIRALAAQ